MAAGMGMGLAGGTGPWAPAAPPPAPPVSAAPPPPPPPPPPPAARVWHLAEAGATSGPFGEADLRAMAASGRLTGAAMVWTPGQDGWKPAAETELAGLFAVVPPPPGA